MEKSNIVATTRVRLARNLKGYPFPHMIKDESTCGEIIDRISDCLAEGTDMRTQRVKDMKPLERRRLVERHVISPELAKLSRGALIATPDNSISVMVNEEDHIRIQAVCAGLNIDKALMAAGEVENMLKESLMLAYDDEFGYLTACPTNVGTGMRISAMVHLPALSRGGAMSDLANSLARIGYTIRGVYGEGSEQIGSMYQISNEVTLGSTKAEIAEDFKRVIDKVCDSEMNARREISRQMGAQLEDEVMRSLGQLKYCRCISSSEAIGLLSNIALGISLDWIRADIQSVYDAFWEIMPACLAAENESAARRDMKRAKYLNELLKEV